MVPLAGLLLGNPLTWASLLAAAAAGWFLAHRLPLAGRSPAERRQGRGGRAAPLSPWDPAGFLPALLREGARMMAESVGREAGEAAVVAVDQVRGRVCLACPRRRECWEGEAAARRVLGSFLRAGGRPVPVLRQLGCLRPRELETALRVAVPLVELAELHRRGGEDLRLVLAAHLWEMARIAERTGAPAPTPAPGRDRPLRLGYRLEIVKQAAPGRIVSGDAHLVWEEGAGGRLLVALGDGMGRGLRAARLSRFATGWLQRLVRGGVEVPQALRLLNTLLGLAGRGEETVSLDVAEVELAGGRAAVYKAGAPPSYLLRGGRPRVLASPAAPLGVLAEGSWPATACTFQSGDVFVMLSDGVLDGGGKQGWVEDWLARWAAAPGSPGALAAGLLAAAGEGCAGLRADDRSVLVLTFARGADL